MNKTALKKFATEARVELLEKVELQARKLGITAESIQKANVESSDAVFIDGKRLSDTERRQRNKLIARINEIGFDRVMEETAYTWFNRFIALRYMEVNDYLPTKVRVLSSNTGSSEPDMMKEALSLDLDLDKEKVYDMKMNNETDELFKYLIKMHCNDLNRYMPFMFETIEDYTEILFPEGLLGTDSFVREMTDTEVIAEDSWEKVEIIGWLYQYYISEENERVIKAKKRYKAEELPFATQLFTPEWIVRYMVQNALGRYWIESHPEHRDLIQNCDFYLENPNPEADFEEKLAPYINKELNVEDIKCLDPAMGSGHILVYMFDVLHEIYSKCGYMEREIPRLIIEKNLYGLDIDDRAYQLASFSVVMKALQYNKRFLRSIEREELTINLASIQETNTLSDEEVGFLAGDSSGEQFDKMKDFIDQFKHAKAIGSLIKLKSYDVEFLQERLIAIERQLGNLFELDMKDRTLALFRKLINQATLMDLKYDVFITNPPYAGNSYVTPEVSAYLTKNYPDVKSDLFSSFIEYSFHATKENGQMGFMTPFVWMFISSYEKLRRKIISDRSISSLVQLEYSGFDGATVPICTFTLRNYRSEIKGEYVRLSDFRGAENQPTKTLEAVQDPTVSYRYSFDQENFSKIPGSPIAYWTSEDLIKGFEQGKSFGDFGVTKKGVLTGNDSRFVRSWHEVAIEKVGFYIRNHEDMKNSQKKWFPITGGGFFRRWYGNFESVVNLENDAYEIKYDNKNNFRLREGTYYFLEGLTWTEVSSKLFSLRYVPQGILFGNGGPTCFIEDGINYFIALLNSKVAIKVLEILAPTINFGPEQIKKIPCIIDKRGIVEELSKDCISISKSDWDNFETSWDFQRHPFFALNEREIKLKNVFDKWENYSNDQFQKLKSNEEKLNQIFIDMYDLHNELTPEVEAGDIKIHKADLQIDIKSFISYVLGCSFGRYSLDAEGLIYAGGEFDSSRYQTFSPDEDNILPILPGAYFEDDIVTRFVDFVRTTFSAETLEENLDFVADAIGRKKNETAREALRRYFLNDFYKDHVQVYKKRPIYWLFTSGREKAFNCLIYMHRYDKTTLSRIRTDYLHEVQTRLDAEKNDLLEIINGDSTTREINSARRELKSLDRKLDELKAYDELLHHMADMQIEIDLDDGVKVNYEKFKGLVAKI
ncbi:BREX-1 system adenine-specific DNA-methyltransferase PglX [Lederbergia citrea]|uniref:BREX-1 system adenine-specific DNA-methyltransferase PglX n=1 Tax=Lederbergia citrea TaxID=2833581 RepID=UPI001BC9E4DB|nr:BREX-1 system adenine-specific DNA-methyltransferase PglX [Lederbergia citrea]MBS4178780.1 BREX-1 system adenine-specific DNA-methyltransferase PglX [Lederbergia citrea]